MGKHKIEQMRLLRRREVEERTGLSRSTIYEWMRTGQFPRPIALGTRSVRWQQHDVDAWIAERTAAGAVLEEAQ
jgi:prophage regulatory protein